MKASVVITDLTQMRGTRVCLAGYLADGTCVRPEPQDGELTQDWLYSDRRLVVRPFAVVELDLQYAISKPPHTEDWVIDEGYRNDGAVLDLEQQIDELEGIEDPSVAVIFGAPIQTGPGWYIPAGQGNRSLGTISPQRVWEVHLVQRESGRWDYRLAFTDRSGHRYSLAVTDLAFRRFLDYRTAHDGLSVEEASEHLTRVLQQSRVFLRIGLARPWEQFPDRCYLQITGVYSFPDYLSGRSFADFRQQ